MTLAFSLLCSSFLTQGLKLHSNTPFPVRAMNQYYTSAKITFADVLKI